MRIAIIGAGFAGLSAAYELTRSGIEVSVFERDNAPGGLALGFKEKNWKWSLEKHYHHWFTNDKFILSLASEIGHEVVIKRPKTSIYVQNNIYQFDSPKEVLLFPKLSIFERIRMGVVLAFLRYNPFWLPLEKINATEFLPKTIGKKGYKMIWEPLFKNKFGKYINDVSLSWFWARIVKRTPSLAYPKGGFLEFANHLVNSIEKKGGNFYFGTEVFEISSDIKPRIKFKGGNSKLQSQNFDAIVVTLPSFLFLKIAKGLPLGYQKKFAKLKSLGATNLMLRLNKPFLKDGTYWLSICNSSSPVMAVVEQTNFMDKKNYGNEHLVYLGNYLPQDSNRFNLSKEETLRLFENFLKKINPDFEKSLIGYELFKAPFAQPVIPTNYSKMIPPMTTPLKNVYLANIDQVYPWDRGTNYAVEVGQKVAKLILSET